MPDGPKNVAKNTKGALKNNIHIQISGLTLHGIALNFAQTWPEKLDRGGFYSEDEGGGKDAVH